MVDKTFGKLFSNVDNFIFCFLCCGCKYPSPLTLSFVLHEDYGFVPELRLLINSLKQGNLNKRCIMSTSLADLDVDQVVALLASWRLDKQMAPTIREQDIDGFMLNEAEQDDFSPADFPAMSKVCALSSKQKSNACKLPTLFCS